jgi:anti-anti-sigma regulatory factor
MLRITVHDNSESLTVQLEGRLAGPWVRELEDCWQSTRVSQRKAVLCFDLTGVTYIDAAGKEFLAAMHTQGAEFLARGCLMRAVVAEITDGSGSRPPLSEERGRKLNLAKETIHE